jgi:hypothetical protein
MMMPAMTSISMPAVLAMAASLSLRFLVQIGTNAAATQLSGQAGHRNGSSSSSIMAGVVSGRKPQSEGISQTFKVTQMANAMLLTQTQH